MAPSVDGIAYYRMKAPTERAGPPAWYSPTSLASLRTCTLRWQLVHSRWGDLPRLPDIPNRKRVAGSVAHDLLEAMIRQLGRHGRPARGTPEFRAALRALNVRAVLAARIEKAERAWQEHPRARGTPLALDADELRNRAYRMFRQSYRPSAGSPASGSEGGPSGRPLGAEVAIEDDELRIRGRIDLALPRELIEFKTGSPRDEHREQLKLYALLWQRQRDVLPSLKIVYPSHTERWNPSSTHLQQLCERIKDEITELDLMLSGVAPAQPGEHCRYCQARAFCDDYWEAPVEGDLELVVTLRPSEFVVGDGSTTVGLQAAHVASVGAIDVGNRVRLLGVRPVAEALELARWGEVFVSE